MTHFEKSTIMSFDNTIFRFWQQPTTSRACALIVHGWGMHSLPYTPLAQALAQNGLEIVAVDLPGHGLAKQEEFSLRGAHLAIAACSQFLRSRNTHQPLTIIGDSLGATLALTSYARSKPDQFALISPGLLPRVRQLLGLRALRDGARLMLTGKLPLKSWRLETVLADAQFLAERRDDTLTLDYVGLRYIASSACAAAHALCFDARVIPVPIHIWHGQKDRLLSPRGSRLLYRCLRTNDKNLTVIARAEHALLWDRSSAADLTNTLLEYVSNATKV